jgi:hypothetical protein
MAADSVGSSLMVAGPSPYGKCRLTGPPGLLGDAAVASVAGVNGVDAVGYSGIDGRDSAERWPTLHIAMFRYPCYSSVYGKLVVVGGGHSFAGLIVGHPEPSGLDAPVDRTGTPHMR